MKQSLRTVVVACLFVLLTLSSIAQQAKKAGILESAELKQVVPTNYFFDGQIAPVQLRNSVAIRVAEGKMVLAGLVDNSGYSSDVAQKYQGFLITTMKLNVQDKSLVPGQYGFGFTKDGKFLVQDVAGNDILTVTFQTDENLKRPVPLQATEDNGNYRLYAGKKYVVLNVK
jgi:hypothetical protein